MKPFKKEKLFNDPSYDIRSNELITKIYQIVKELSDQILKSDSSSICLVSSAFSALYLFDNGAWEVRNSDKGTRLVSSLKDIEVIIGYYFAPPDDLEPESYFFRIEPDIKRTQICQHFFRILEVALDEYEVK